MANLVVLKARKAAVLQLAHDSSHFGSVRTFERIIGSGLTWGSGPGVKSVRAAAAEYASTCTVCQMHARKSILDRVPIQNVEQEPEVFRHLAIDVFGAVMPLDKLKYNYALVVICAVTHYPFAFPLTAPTTRNICNALMKMFEVTGIHSEIIITSDNASYFRSALMREFNKRLGITPRFSTPYHPEGHGLVERAVQNLKRLVA